MQSLWREELKWWKCYSCEISTWTISVLVIHVRKSIDRKIDKSNSDLYSIHGLISYLGKKWRQLPEKNQKLKKMVCQVILSSPNNVGEHAIMFICTAYFRRRERNVKKPLKGLRHCATLAGTCFLFCYLMYFVTTMYHCLGGLQV